MDTIVCITSLARFRLSSHSRTKADSTRGDETVPAKDGNAAIAYNSTDISCNGLGSCDAKENIYQCRLKETDPVAEAGRQRHSQSCKSDCPNKKFAESQGAKDGAKVDRSGEGNDHAGCRSQFASCPVGHPNKGGRIVDGSRGYACQLAEAKVQKTLDSRARRKEAPPSVKSKSSSR